MTLMSDTFRAAEPDGTVREAGVAAEQPLDHGPGKAIAYIPRDERVLGDGGPTITVRESALPQLPEAA
jgi:hypothetical protein